MGVCPLRSVHAASIGRRIEMKSRTEGKNGSALPDLIVHTAIIPLKVEEKDEVADYGRHRPPETGLETNIHFFTTSKAEVNGSNTFE